MSKRRARAGEGGWPSLRLSVLCCCIYAGLGAPALGAFAFHTSGMTSFHTSGKRSILGLVAAHTQGLSGLCCCLYAGLGASALGAFTFHTSGMTSFRTSGMTSHRHRSPGKCKNGVKKSKNHYTSFFVGLSRRDGVWGALSEGGGIIFQLLLMSIKRPNWRAIAA